MFLQVFIIIICLLFIYFLYIYKKAHYHFDANGLKYLPGVPIFGNTLKSTFLIRHFVYDLGEVYDAFPDEKYVGFIDGLNTSILVRDPELMKVIVIKDSSYFQNRKLFFPVRLDPLLGRNIIQLQDDEWQTMRTQMTPAFTPVRIKTMLPALIDVSKEIIKSIKDSPSKQLEISRIMYIYAVNSIASAAFGFSQDTADLENSVISKIGSTIKLTPLRRALSLVSLQFPILGEVLSILGLQLFPKKSHDCIRKMVSEALDYRKRYNITILDYMDILLKNSEGKSLDDLAAQVFFTLTASVGSATGILQFSMHELALHPDMQERLYQEIKNHEELGEMTMESISNMKYLSCILNEVSRRWSGAVMMDRMCTKTFILPPPRKGGKTYLVKPGVLMFNVVNSVQSDPKYFKDPEIFDPERFSDENKQNIKPYTYMPFGMGPRKCIGDRLATLQLKVMIYYMVLNFRLEKCESTADPIKLEPSLSEVTMRVKGGTWLRLEPRI